MAKFATALALTEILMFNSDYDEAANARMR